MASMSKNKFNELLQSVKEAGMMESGDLLPEREFVIEKKMRTDSPSVRAFAVCLTDEDESLIPMKIYHVTVQPKLKTCTVKDENGETVVCPAEWFLPIEFPTKIERLLETKELALA
jgi:hypothetical protein